ncbi:hypothetical protein C8Q77DRAFT_1098480 [Trametes polyzona]|nr:hypothetical protein C8Q77DRAFT_1098480 [Trametes polyzona]
MEAIAEALVALGKISSPELVPTSFAELAESYNNEVRPDPPRCRICYTHPRPTGHRSSYMSCMQTHVVRPIERGESSSGHRNTQPRTTFRGCGARQRQHSR